MKTRRFTLSGMTYAAVASAFVYLKTSRAWCIKENFSQFWSYSYKGAARRFFKAWSNNAMRSKLEPVKKVVKMLRRHEEGLMNFSQHRISNACAEGFNSAIQLIKAN